MHKKTVTFLLNFLTRSSSTFSRLKICIYFIFQTTTTSESNLFFKIMKPVSHSSCHLLTLLAAEENPVRFWQCQCGLVFHVILACIVWTEEFHYFTLLPTRIWQFFRYSQKIVIILSHETRISELKYRHC